MTEKEMKAEITQAHIDGYNRGFAKAKDKIADIKANCDLAIEGRDVNIMELEKENAELKKKLKEKLKTIADKDLSFVAKFDALEKENAELKGQVEKMKCCQNCKNYTWNMSNEKCQFRCESQNACDNWELKG